MSNIPEEIKETLFKWEKVKIAYEVWYDTLAPKYKVGETIYNQVKQVFSSITEDLENISKESIVAPCPKCAEKDIEIERLKGLVEDAYVQGRNDEKSMSEINGWQQFKTENNL